MPIYVKLRHYLDDNESLRVLEEIAEDMVVATGKRPNFRFSVLIGYEPSFLKERFSGFSRIMKTIIESDAEVLLEQGFGPGVAFLGGVFNFMAKRSVDKGGPVIFLIDGDQFTVS